MMEGRIKEKKVPAREPAMTFDCKQGIVRIHKATIEALGWPEFYRFLYRAEKKSFAIEVCSMDDEGYHIFRGFRENSRNSYNQNSLAMIEAVFEQCGWDKAKVYRVAGVSVFDGRMVYFDLNEAVPITN